MRSRKTKQTLHESLSESPQAFQCLFLRSILDVLLSLLVGAARDSVNATTSFRSSSSLPVQIKLFKRVRRHALRTVSTRVRHVTIASRAALTRAHRFRFSPWHGSVRIELTERPRRGSREISSIARRQPIVSYPPSPSPPPTGVRGAAHVILGTKRFPRTRLCLLTPDSTRAGGSPRYSTAVSTGGKRLSCGERLRSDPTLRSPSSMRLEAAELS